MGLQVIGNQDHGHHQRLGRARKGCVQYQRETKSTAMAVFWYKALGKATFVILSIGLVALQVAWGRGGT